MSDNLRRFPSDTSDLKSDKYMDILYATLQMLSEWDPTDDSRFVRLKGTKRITKTQLSNFSNMSRPTVDSHLKKLEDGGYIIIDEDRISLPKVGKFYFLIPYDTLKYMSDIFRPNVIKVYTYLGRMWEYYIKEKRSYQNVEVVFTENVLLEEIGYAISKPENHVMMRNILIALSMNRLIRFHKKTTKIGNEVYILDVINTTLDEVEVLEKI